MARGYAYIDGAWVRITGSDLQLGPGANQAAPGDHKHPVSDFNSGTLNAAQLPAGTVVRLVYTTAVPARPTAVAGYPYVEWVGQVNPGASALEGDTFTPTGA